MKFTVPTFYIFVLTLVILVVGGCAEPSTNRSTQIVREPTTVETSLLNGCSTRSCRMTEYETANGLNMPKEPGVCTRIQTDECTPIHFCAIRSTRTQGNAHSLDSTGLMVGLDQAGVKHAANAFQNVGGDYNKFNLLGLKNVIDIPFFSVLETLRSSNEDELALDCRVVHVDSCAKRIGYSCETTNPTMMLQVYDVAEKPTRRYQFELELSGAFSKWQRVNGRVDQVLFN